MALIGVDVERRAVKAADSFVQAEPACQPAVAARQPLLSGLDVAGDEYSSISTSTSTMAPTVQVRSRTAQQHSSTTQQHSTAA